jgi:hypothetical protein
VYIYQYDHMFAAGRDKMIPREKQTIDAHKVILTIFFTSRHLIILDSLLSHQTYTQNYFTENILPDIVREKTRFCRKHRRTQFDLHTNNSECHNARNVTTKIPDARLKHILHSAYSPDLSLCDLWIFEMMKEIMKGYEFETIEDILRAMTDISEDQIFIDVQHVFFNWMNHLQWVIEHERCYYIN